MTEPRRSLQTPLVLVLGVLLLAVGVRAAMQGGWTTHLPAYLTDSPGVLAAERMRSSTFGLIIAMITAVPLVGGLWLAAIGCGWPLRHVLLDGSQQWSPFSRVVGQAGLGMAALLQVNWLLAWAGGLNGVSAWGLIGLGALALRRRRMA